MTSGFSSCPIANQTDGPKREHSAKTEETGSVPSDKRADHAPEAEAFDESPTGESRRLLPNDRAAYIEVLGEEAKCPLLNEEIADWARKLGGPGHDGERELKELLILAFLVACPFVSEKSAEGRDAARQLPNLAGRINKIHANLSQLPANIQSALCVRVVFRARLNHDKAMAWLRILPRMLEDLAEDWGRPWPKPKSKQSLAGRPSLERDSFVIDVLYEAVEEFIGKRLSSPRSTNDNEGLQLVRLLVQRMFPLAATEEGGIPTMLGHFHKRWLRRKKQTAAT